LIFRFCLSHCARRKKFDLEEEKIMDKGELF